MTLLSHKNSITGNYMIRIKLPSLRKIKNRCRSILSGIHGVLQNGFKKLMRRCYYIGFNKCILIAAVSLIAITVLCAVCIKRKHNRTVVSPVPTPEISIVSSPNPVQITEPAITPVIEITPEPTPKILLKRGDEGEEITKLQDRLMDLGYLDIDEPGTRFGSATRDAVELFQRQHDLEQDGIVGNSTYDLLMSKDAKPYVMFEGARGSDIKAFQLQLYELGYLKRDQITGYYGSATVEAVKSFQKRNKLSQDGKAGEKTIDTINSPKVRVSASKEASIKREKEKEAAEAKTKSKETRIDAFISVAKSKLGCSYKLGESGPDRFDCSGFVYYCLRQSHVYCLRMNANGFSQNTDWPKVSGFEDIKRGDLLFFKISGRRGVGHVGIYLGDGEMIDASTAEGKVVIRSCTTNFWKRNYVCARRPIR